MRLVWNPEFESNATFGPFPFDLLQKTFSINHPDHAFAVYSKGKPVLYSASLASLVKSDPESFVNDVEGGLRALVSQGDKPFFNERFLRNKGWHTFATGNIHSTSEWSCVRVAWFPFDKNAECLVMILGKEKEKDCLPDLSAFQASLRALFVERDHDLAMKLYVQALSGILRENPRDDHEFIRHITKRFGNKDSLLERVYSSNQTKFDRPVNSEDSVEVPRVRGVSYGHSSQMSLAGVRFHVGLFPGGVLPIGYLNLSGDFFQQAGSATLFKAIKESGLGAASLPFVSGEFSIFRHWKKELGAFSDAGLADIVSYLPCQDPVVLPVSDYSSFSAKIRGRVRTNDILVSDEQGSQGLIILSGCPNIDTAKRTIHRDLSSMNVPVSEPVHLSQFEPAAFLESSFAPQPRRPPDFSMSHG